MKKNFIAIFLGIVMVLMALGTPDNILSDEKNHEPSIRVYPENITFDDCLFGEYPDQEQKRDFSVYAHGIHGGHRKDMTVSLPGSPPWGDPGFSWRVAAKALREGTCANWAGVESRGENSLMLPEDTDVLVDVMFNPPMATGVYEKVLTISSNAENSADGRVNLLAEVFQRPVPNISVSPASIDFSGVQVGTTAKRTFTITNPSQVNVVCGPVCRDQTNEFCWNFHQTAQQGQEYVRSELALTPGGSCTYEIAFSPRVPGDKWMVIGVQYWDVNRAYKEKEIIVFVKGRGITGKGTEGPQTEIVVNASADGYEPDSQTFAVDFEPSQILISGTVYSNNGKQSSTLANAAVELKMEGRNETVTTSADGKYTLNVQTQGTKPFTQNWGFVLRKKTGMDFEKQKPVLSTGTVTPSPIPAPTPTPHVTPSPLQNRPPTVRITYSPNNPTDRDLMYFYDDASDLDNDPLTVTYYWKQAGATGWNVLSFPRKGKIFNAGSYVVTVKASDGKPGGAVTDTVTFTVGRFIPTDCLCSNLFVSDLEPQVGDVLRISSDISNPGSVGTDCSVQLKLRLKARPSWTRFSELIYVSSERTKRVKYDLPIGPMWAAQTMWVWIEGCNEQEIWVRPRTLQSPGPVPTTTMPPLGRWRNRFEDNGDPDDLRICSRYWQGGYTPARWSPECKSVSSEGAVDGFALCNGEQAGGYNTGWLVYSPKGSGDLKYTVFAFSFKDHKGYVKYSGGLDLHGKIPIPESINFIKCEKWAATVQWKTEEGSLCRARIWKTLPSSKFSKNIFIKGGVKDLGCVDGAPGGTLRQALQAAAQQHNINPGEVLRTPLEDLKRTAKRRDCNTPNCGFNVIGNLSNANDGSVSVGVFDDAKDAEECLIKWYEYYADDTGFYNLKIAWTSFHGLKAFTWSMCYSDKTLKKAKRINPNGFKDWIGYTQYGLAWIQDNAWVAIYTKQKTPAGRNAVEALAETVYTEMAAISDGRFYCVGEGEQAVEMIAYRSTEWPVRLNNGKLEVAGARGSTTSWKEGQWEQVDTEVTNFSGKGTSKGPVIIYQKSNTRHVVMMDWASGAIKNPRRFSEQVTFKKAGKFGVILQVGDKCYDYSWNDLKEVWCKTGLYKW